MPSFRICALLGAALFGSAAAAQPDGFGRIDNRQLTPQSGYYINARPGEPTTRVMVWGEVLRPGVYEVGPGFEMGEVLSLAGLTLRETQVPGAPDLYVRLIRPEAGARAVVYDATLEAFARGEGGVPALQDGDVIEVDPRPVVRVYVWGAVKAPGVYEVGPDYDAQGILSLAGGPVVTPLRNNQRREVVVRIYKAGSGQTDPVYEQPLDAFVQGAAAVPDLANGDVIEVETRDRDGWTTRDTLTVAGVTASGLLAITQFLRFILE